MKFDLSHLSPVALEADWLVIPTFQPPQPSGESTSAGWLSPAEQQIDQTAAGLLERVRASGDVTGKLGATVPLRGVPGTSTSRVLYVGLGLASEITVGRLERALTTAARFVSDRPEMRLGLLVPVLDGTAVSVEQFVQSAAIAFQVGGVGQDIYRSEKGRYPIAEVTVFTETTSTVTQSLSMGMILGEAVNLTRDLINRPAQEITPESFADRAAIMAQETGLACEVWDESRLRLERMESLLAVAKGSSKPARLVKLEHQGGLPGGSTLCLVGKGVTFDSGGLSLKPTDGMLTMKCDMAGAATVMGAMQAIARLKLPINVIGLMGLVENMTGGAAFKLGDILTARNGVTIEVLNTDAEGRLVLADVLSYAVDLGVDRIVDLATLTGACVVALGEDVAGAFTNEQSWCDTVIGTARSCGEEVWQLPMYDHYNELIKGDVGDIKNTGGRWGGAITAAKFLERFVGGKPWVHLDIAGPAYTSSNKPYREAGATGCFVKTLVELAKNSG